MTLTTLIRAAVDDNPALKWTLTHSGAIRREDGACPLEAAAGTGPHTLWTKARARFASWDDRSLEKISCAADLDWWPHRMAEWHIRRQMLEAFGLMQEDAVAASTDWMTREEAA